MYYKTLPLLLLSATAMAAPQDSYSDILADLGSLATVTSVPTSIPGVPNSVVQVLATAAPTTWVNEIATNSAALSSVLNDLESSKYPDWWSSVPSDVQSYVWAEQSSFDATATPTGTGSTLTSTTTTGASSTSTSDSTSTSTGAASETPSEGAAPAQTAMAATVAGAAGILGLALAL